MAPRVVRLEANLVHVDLGYQFTYLRGDCPICASRGEFVVLLAETPRRFICKTCRVEGTDTGTFLRALLACRVRGDEAQRAG